jgi:hypothetical protein
MSHFTVLVVGDDVSTLLAPFNEQPDDNDEHVQMVFEDHTEQFQEQYETASIEKIVLEDGTLVYPWDKCFAVPDPKLRGFTNNVVPENLERRQVPFKELYPTFEEFVLGHHNQEAEEDGRYGYYHNPNAKWDWYQLGGRWSGMLQLKADIAEAMRRREDLLLKNEPVPEDLEQLLDGIARGDRSWQNREKDISYNRVDRARKRQIDFDGIRGQAAEEAGAQYDKVMGIVEHLNDFTPWPTFLERVSENRDNLDALRHEYRGQRANQALFAAAKENQENQHLQWINLEGFMVSREEFMQKARDNALITFAVLKDGEWYERGEMGWWGMVHNEQDKNTWAQEFNKLLEELPDDAILNIVDCHI